MYLISHVWCVEFGGSCYVLENCLGLFSDLLRLDGSARSSVSGVETCVTFLLKFYWLCSKWQIWPARVAQSVQWSLCGLNDRGVAFRFPAVTKDFYFLHNFNTVSGTWPASCSVGTMGSFDVVKEAGAWSCSLTYIQSQVEEWVELHLHMPLWNAQGQLSLLFEIQGTVHRDIFL